MHDLGVMGVSNAVWDHPGTLGPTDRERVRLDGSGYPAGLKGEAMVARARVVVAGEIRALSVPAEDASGRPETADERA